RSTRDWSSDVCSSDLHLRGLAVRADVELAVQTRRRIVGDQVQREALGQRRAEPLRRLEPGRLSGAVRVAEPVDGRREDLDLAARRAEGRPLWIGAKLLEQHQILVGAGQIQEPG